MAERTCRILPPHVGPCEFGTLGQLIAVQCPVELAHILRRAGAVWEPRSRRWLVQRRRIGPVIRALEQATDPCSGELVSIWTTSKTISPSGRCPWNLGGWGWPAWSVPH